MKRISIFGLLSVLLMGCTLASTDVDVRQIGYGIYAKGDYDDEASLHYFEFPQEIFNIDPATGFVLNSVTIGDNQELETTIYFRNSKEAIYAKPVAVLENQSGERTFEDLEESFFGLGSSYGVLSFNSDMENSDGSSMHVKTNIVRVDPLLKLELLSFDENHQLLNRVDAMGLTDYTIDSSYIIFEETRESVHGKPYINRTVFTADNPTVLSEKPFTFAYFSSEEAIVGTLGIITINRGN